MMNNVVYDQRDFYSSRSNMCFENKGMVTPTPSDRASSQTVHVNIVDPDKAQNEPPKTQLWRKIRLAHYINSFIILLVSSLIVVIEYGFMPASKMGYTCNDPLISHKYQGETITPLILAIGCLILPLLVLLCTELLSKESYKRIDGSIMWYFYKELLVGGTLVLLLTEIGKVLIGEPRPHFLDVCQPDTAIDCVPGTFVDEFKCTSTKFTDYAVVDSSRSFPSGHASVSVFVGIFSAYVIYTRLPTTKTGWLFKPFLLSVCLTWSLLCSLSRISDKRHHWWDVLAGSVLGTLGAIYSINLVHNRVNRIEDTTPRISMSTTTLLDVKNKDATSVII